MQEDRSLGFGGLSNIILKTQEWCEIVGIKIHKWKIGKLEGCQIIHKQLKPATSGAAVRMKNLS
jgi:hypothetical protein